MIPETQIEEKLIRDDRSKHELASGILGIGLLAAVLYGALALLRRKAIFLRPLMALVFIVLALALLGTLLKALRSRRFDRS